MSPTLSRRRFLSRSAATGAGAAAAASGLGDAQTATTREDGLESLVDDAAERALTDHDAGGLTVAVVDGDRVLTKGYGHAFHSESVPVDPAETLFRVASVSKVVTWTAAMQMVDRGEVAPDTPVNDALSAVEIPQTYDDPITLEHLATHTPGFEVRFWGNSVENPEHVRPLAESVSANVPARVRPPGELPRYTNYAAALAGQLVAEVAGTTFGAHVSESVFEPLGMANSTFRSAVPELVPAEDTPAEDVVSFYSDVAPASGLHTTGADMAQLLRAHLNGGVVDGARLLSESAVEEMHRRWYAPHERMDGMTFGLFEESRGDARLVRHSGADSAFACEFCLLPDDDVGLFVVAHGDEASSAYEEVVDALLKRFAPVEADAKPLAPSGTPERADELGGRYRSGSVAENASAAKLAFAFFSGRPVDVRLADDGRLVTEQGDQRDEWVEVEPLLFRHVEGDEMLLFREENGEVTHLLDGLGVYERLAYHERMSVQGWLAVVAGTVALTGLLGWPVARLWRRFRGGSGPPPAEARARWVAGAGAAGPLLFVLAFVVFTVAVASMDRPPLFNRPPSWAGLVFVAPSAGAAATTVAGGLAARAWYRGEWSVWSHVHYSAVVTVAAVLYGLLRYWNLLVVRWF